MTVGHRVESDHPVPEGLTSVAAPKQKLPIYETDGPRPLFEQWQANW